MVIIAFENHHVCIFFSEEGFEADFLNLLQVNPLIQYPLGRTGVP